MTLILSGTDGLSDVDGTAATPAIRGTDTNTGIFFPAADTIAFSEGGVESMRIDSSGRLLIGGTSTYDFNGQANLVVNGTSNNATITIASTGIGYLAFADGTSGTDRYAGRIDYDHGSNFMAFNTAATERARIDSSGNLLVGATAQVSAEKFLTFQNVGGQNVIHARLGSSASSCTGFLTSNATGASSFDYFGAYNGSGTKMAGIVSTGTFQSATNTYGGTSDERLKENIVDATPKLGDLLKVKVRNFNFKSDETKLKQIGVVAQELETVFPGLVEETPTWDMEGNDTGTVKLVKYSVFVPMLIKAIQEQQAIIQSLTARIEALEGK